MNDTATSSVIKIIIAGLTNIDFSLILQIKDPNRISNRCPATIFAMSRTDSVMGRIMFLTSSIRTMKFIRAVGVPCGTKCTIYLGTLLFRAMRLIDNHIPSDAHKVTLICPVVEKI